MRYINPYTHSYCYTNCNPYSYSNSNTNTNRNGDPNSYTDPNCHSNGNPYSYADIDSDGYAHTGTDYSLSTITDDRSYQGSQHTVQFHGTSKRH